MFYIITTILCFKLLQQCYALYYYNNFMLYIITEFLFCIITKKKYLKLLQQFYALNFQLIYCATKSRRFPSIQPYVIKLVSDLRQVSCFLRVLPFPPPKRN